MEFKAAGDRPDIIASHPILEYAPKRSAPRTLMLEETDGDVRVIFAVEPTWLYWLPIVINGAMGAFVLVAAFVVYRRIHGMSRPPFRATDVGGWVIRKVLGECGIGAVVLWALAADSAWQYYKWGRVPRVLTANDKGLVLSRLAWRRIRERIWSADNIAAIELRPLKRNLNWKRTAADLLIHRQKGRRIRFRLSSRDRELPRRIARALAGRIGVRLIEKQPAGSADRT